MIYKFEAETNGAYLEVQKEGQKAKITLYDNDDIFVLEIEKNTLYDLIGALHSVQTKIKNNDFDNLSNTF